MMTVQVSFVLTEKQHAAFKKLLVSQFNLSLQARWFDDRYRYVKGDQRAAVIIRSNPEIAAARKAIAALQKTPVSSTL